jgi:hypothetical protein
VKVGDLVRMRPAVAPPKLYGVGIIVKVTGNNGPDRRCFVKWPTMPAAIGLARYALELVSESR